MPADSSTLASLRQRYDRILRALHREAQADRCPGDIFTGWDWPTLRIVKPNVYAELHRLDAAHRTEYIALRSAGLLA